MRRVLIAGDNSYIGNCAKPWLEQYNNEFAVDIISLADDSWLNLDFSSYETVFHAAELPPHKDNKETRKVKDEFSAEAYELLKRVANKAKAEDVGQFLFISTMAVFGLDEGVITVDTPVNPKTEFAKRKFESEKFLRSIESDDFKVLIVRPPMVYGYGSSGNYNRLSKLAKKLPFFPDYKNKRSMIHIDNLCELFRYLIDFRQSGTYHPQNVEYARTSEVALKIAIHHNNFTRLTSFFDPLIKFLIGKSKLVTIAFGTLYYDKEISECGYPYHVRRFEESIERTESEIPIDLKYWQTGNKPF